MDVDLPDFTRANCLGADPEAFFPDGNVTTEMGTALRVCAACDIRSECAEWGIHFEGYGIWGGLNATDRNKIRRKRGVVLSSPHLKYTSGAA